MWAWGKQSSVLPINRPMVGNYRLLNNRYRQSAFFNIGSPLIAIRIDTHCYTYCYTYCIFPFFLHSKFYSVLVPCLPPTTKHIKQPRYRSYHCVKEPIWTTIVSQGCSRDLLFRILWLLPWNCSWHIELKIHHRLVVRDNRILPNPALWLANERCVWDRTDSTSFKPLKLKLHFVIFEKEKKRKLFTSLVGSYRKIFGLRPWAIFETSGKYVSIRTFKPVNNMYIFSALINILFHYRQCGGSPFGKLSSFGYNGL